ncbi:MAG: complex I subunit 1 family protein [Phototrophicaceae bacterium]
METLTAIVALLLFPGGIALIAVGLLYKWVNLKLLARAQNRQGPRWFQPFADIAKLLAKEEIIPDGVNRRFFVILPTIALAGALTAALYVPVFGVNPSYSFSGDLIVVIYLLSLLTLCIGLAGSNNNSRFSVIGSTRALTQLFSYEVPFLLAMLGPALVAGSWQISEIHDYSAGRLLLLSQPVGFVIAIIGLMGKLEMPPFDSPEAETEIVAGSLTEYSGRGLGLFRIGQGVELVIGLTLVAAFYLGGVGNPIAFVLKTLGIVVGLAVLQALATRLRIDQTVGLWWRYGALLVLAQWAVLIVFRAV